MIVKISEDERYPIYDISNDLKSHGDFEIEVSEEFYNECEQVQKEYYAMQKKLKILYNHNDPMMILCDECLYVNHPSNLTCSNCGEKL